MGDRQSGQATVELALCLPFVAILVGILLEIGWLGADQIRLWNAAREAARIAAVNPDQESVREAAAASGPGPLVVTTDPPAANRTQGGRVTVHVTHRPAGRVPLVRTLVSKLTLRAEATMRIEQP